MTKKQIFVEWAVIVAIGLIAAFVPSLLFGGQCYVQRSVAPVYGYSYGHYADQIVLKQVYPPYYYAVGTELQLDAIAEKLSQRIEQKLLAKQKAAEAAAVPAAPKSILSTKCFTCHSPGTKAVKENDAPIYFDATGKLTANAEQRASMATAAKLGVMPPAKELTDDEYLELKRDLSNLNPERPGDQ